MPSPDLTSPASARLQSIDALRGLVILFMLLDHVRETFLLHMQVPDPMDVAVTEPALFFSRTLAHLCAPVFIFLTGLSAFLYGAFCSNAGCSWWRSNSLWSTSHGRSSSRLR